MKFLLLAAMSPFVCYATADAQIATPIEEPRNEDTNTAEPQMTTPAEERRDKDKKEAHEYLDCALTGMTFPTSRACLRYATAPNVGFNVSPLGWLMLPGALLLDSLLLPLSAIATPFVAGNLAFREAKNAWEASSDPSKMTEEMKIFKSNMNIRTGQAEKLIGNRFIQKEDLLAFTLGFTAIHSFLGAKNADELIMINGHSITEKETEIFPKTAQTAFRTLVNAKNNIAHLPANLQNEDNFMKELVERMTFEDENKAYGKHSNGTVDVMYRIIESLRATSTNIQETLQGL